MTENNEREALARLIDPNALELHAYPFPLDAADRVLAAGFTCHPQPTEGEPSDAQVLAALNAWDPRFATDDLDDYAPEHIADMRAALRAAWGVADQEGEGR